MSPAMYVTLLLAVSVVAVTADGAYEAGSHRVLQQADAWTSFNEPMAPGAARNPEGPSASVTGVPAAASSSTSVPVFGWGVQPAAAQPVAATAATLQPAPDPQLAAATGGGQLAATAVPAGAAVALPAAAMDPAALAAQQAAAAAVDPAALAAQQAAAAAQQVPLGVQQAVAPAAAAAAAVPAEVAPAQAAAPEPVADPTPAPAPAPSPPMPPGMVARKDITNQIPTTTAAADLPTIKVPEGTTQRFSWVCDANGGLYIGVLGTDRLIRCPGKSKIELSKMLGWSAWQVLQCPDNKKACPGNKAVQLVVNLFEKLEAFQGAHDNWIATIAKAASVSRSQVVVVDVKLMYDRARERAAAAAAKAAAKAASDKAAAKSAPAKSAPAPAKSAPAPAAKPSAKPASIVSPTEGRLRRLLQNNLQAVPTQEIQPVQDTIAAVPTQEVQPVQDTIAKVEEVIGPKPNITVITQIQPLTEGESQTVMGTLGSAYFDETFRAGIQSMKLTLMGNYNYTVAAPAAAYDFAAVDGLPPVPVQMLGEMEANFTGVSFAGNATSRSGVNGSLIPAAAAAGTANATTAPSKRHRSAAAGVVAQSGLSLLAAAAVVAMLV